MRENVKRTDVVVGNEDGPATRILEADLFAQLRQCLIHSGGAVNIEGLDCPIESLESTNDFSHRLF